MATIQDSTALNIPRFPPRFKLHCLLHSHLPTVQSHWLFTVLKYINRSYFIHYIYCSLSMKYTCSDNHIAPSLTSFSCLLKWCFISLCALSWVLYLKKAPHHFHVLHPPLLFLHGTDTDGHDTVYLFRSCSIWFFLLCSLRAHSFWGKSFWNCTFCLELQRFLYLKVSLLHFCKFHKGGTPSL